jgi:hypothetical protein
MLASALAVVGLAACGGSSAKSGTAGGGPLSRAAIDKRADALCSAASKQLTGLAKPTSVTSIKQAAPYFDVAAQIADGLTGQLRALVPAAGVKSDWAAFMTLQVQATQLFDAIKAKADRGDNSAVSDLRQLQKLTPSVDAAAAKSGARVCSGG